MTLAIGIVSYRRPELTSRCLDAVRTSTRLPYQVFVVDNGSPDPETAERLEAWEREPQVTVIRLNSNFGPSYARNRILERLEDDLDVVAMLDNDVVVLPGWDLEALAACERGADLIHPKLLRGDGKTLDRGWTEWAGSSLRAYPIYAGLDRIAEPGELDTERETAIVGTAGVIRRAVFSSVGGYDEALFVCEDIDFSVRARSSGFRLVYAPAVVMLHDHAFQLDYDLERSRPDRLLASHVRYWCKHERAILSPRHLAWYLWLSEHGKPMYLRPDRGLREFPQRLRRRLAREFCFRRYRTWWRSHVEAARAADRVAQRVRAEGRPG